MKHLFWTLFIGALFGTACSAEQESELAPPVFSASISVADSIDQTGDFSGFEILVFSRPTAAAAADTLFYGITDSTGSVNGVVNLKEDGAFPTQITRNGTNLGIIRVLFAFGDTVNITGQFPSFQETFEVQSNENRAMELFERVENGYRRTSQYIINGQVADSLIPAELQKWANLYWDLVNDEKGTFAAKFALESLVTLLNQYDQSQMFTKLNQSFDEDLAFGLAITVGKEYVADRYGIERSIAYLDSVKSITDEPDIIRAVEQSVIKLNYDSLRVEEARNLLQEYNDTYNDEETEASFWYKNMRYELTYLAPGMPLPPFYIETTDGDTVTNASMLGSTYILDFALMENQLYQNQYDEATVIYQLYNPQGLNFITIPFDQSTNTIIAFFQERDRYWELAEPPSFSKKDFIEDFNIQFFPTRILIDKEGNIVRKYVGEEFDDMIPAITETINK